MPGVLLPPATDLTLPPDDIPIVVREPLHVAGNVSPFELIIICKFVRALRPKRLFEIGTFDGRTTLNLAANSPTDAVVYTLDLPQAALDATHLPLEAADRQYIDKCTSGSRYVNTDREKQIVQLWGDSATFDFSPYKGNIDFVFVDGSHSYEYVLHDSRSALALLRDGKGLILWHDYGTPWWHGVTRALNELFLQIGVFGRLRRIEGTALACLAAGVNLGPVPGDTGEASILGSAKNAIARQPERTFL
jgi:predicted O-methyltransferase YrrM